MSVAMAMRRSLLALTAVVMMDTTAMAQQQKPNILVIMADDIGDWNISAYNRGMMGYHTPNIDRIAKTLEGFHALAARCPRSGCLRCHAFASLTPL